MDRYAGIGAIGMGWTCMGASRGTGRFVSRLREMGFENPATSFRSASTKTGMDPSFFDMMANEVSVPVVGGRHVLPLGPYPVYVVVPISCAEKLAAGLTGIAGG